MKLNVRDRFWLLFYCLLTISLSGFLLRYNYFIGHDGVYYTFVGKHLFEGKGIVLNPGEPYLRHPPFFPFLIGLLNFLLRDLELSGHLVALFAFSLTVVPLFLLAKEIYPGPTGHWVSLLYLSNGYLLSYSNQVLSDPLYTLLVLTELYLTLALIKEKPRPVLLASLLGGVGGTAYLTRVEGLFITGMCLLAFLLLSQRPFLWRLRTAALATILFLPFFLPYLNFTYQVTHRWQLSGGVPENVIKRQLDVANPGRYDEIKKLYEGLSSDKTKLKIEELGQDFILFDFLKRDRFALLRSSFEASIWRLRELTDHIFSGLGFFLIGASFLASPWGRKRKISEFLLLLFLVPFASYLFVVHDPRRYLSLLPILLLWMGHGVEILKSWARESFKLTLGVSRGVALGACLFFAIPGIRHVHRAVNYPKFQSAHQELGFWMKENIPRIEEEPVAAQTPFVNFYSGSRIVKLPYVEKLEDLLTYLDHKKVRYFVISEEMDDPFRQTYQSLLDEARPLPPRLHRQHVVGEKNKIILYEVRG